MGISGLCGSNSEAPGESRDCYPISVKPPDMTFWAYTSIGLAWQLTRPAHFTAKPEWMLTTCSNALDSRNTRLMTS
ncbi:hypothetical protein TNCV_2313881 [Trichonephila clavipes]|nr:hypothetical protein TNCV_2313881 [Trichonephila clavipes]